VRTSELAVFPCTVPCVYVYALRLCLRLGGIGSDHTKCMGAQ
jgi:hypothetical protein